MFRRKDELDLDNDTDTQGSLLGAEPDTVSVLSPEKAAEYKANQEQYASRATASTPVNPAASSSAAASGFGQTARPIPAPTASDANRPTPSSSNFNASNANQNSTVAASPTPASRPVSEAPRFRPQTEARPISTPTSNAYSESPAMMNKPNSNERILTVGNDILLKGEITTCDRLVIEGNVDATVSDVTTMVLAQSGSFKGTAEVEFAEISGEFEGNLTVRGSLVVHRTGRISGSITYGEIEIARGGTITGEIKTIAIPASAGKKEEKAAA